MLSMDQLSNMQMASYPGKVLHLDMSKVSSKADEGGHIRHKDTMEEVKINRCMAVRSDEHE